MSMPDPTKKQRIKKKKERKKKGRKKVRVQKRETKPLTPCELSTKLLS